MKKAIAILAVSSVVVGLAVSCGPSIGEEIGALEEEEGAAAAAQPGGAAAQPGSAAEAPQPGSAADLGAKEFPDPDFKLSAPQYLVPYERDEAAADAKFRDKIIALSGVIEETRLDTLPLFVVVRGANDDDLVKCVFVEESLPALDTLWKGQSATVQGIGDGKDEKYVNLRECGLKRAIKRRAP